jgi:hypothetical protein
MIGDHHGRTARRATLLVRTVDEILGTHRSSTIQRQVRDGRRFRAVKVALEPRSLERSLRELGWVIEVKPLAGPFLLGLGGRAG